VAVSFIGGGNRSTNKTDRHDITEILLKVVFNTIKHLKLLTHEDYATEEASTVSLLLVSTFKVINT
jgi:hypothetical protein